MIKTDFESQLERGLKGIGCENNGIYFISPQKGITMDGEKYSVIKRWSADYGDIGLVYLLGIDVPYDRLKNAEMDEVQAYAAAAVDLGTAKERIRMYRSDSGGLEHIKTIDAAPGKEFAVCNNNYGSSFQYDPVLMSMIVVNRLLREAKFAAKG